MPRDPWLVHTPQTGRWGYWHNANAQWDHWRVGGRWTGYYPLRAGVPRRLGKTDPLGRLPAPGFGDIVHPREIDAEAVAKIRAEGAAAFAEAYGRLLEHPGPGVLDEAAQNDALRIGLLRCEQGPADAPPGHVAFPWFASEPSTRPDAAERATWTAIARRVDRGVILAEHAWAFDPLPTFVAVNDEGWHAPAMSAWFAFSDENPEATAAFTRTFVERFVLPAKGEDLLVLVDCHL